MVASYTKLEKEKPNELSHSIVTLAKLLKEKGIREHFVKRWMEKAFEIDANNSEALFFLSKYRFQENVKILDILLFNPLRESDTRSQKEKTLLQYK